VRCRELAVQGRTLEREIRDLAQMLVPELLAFPGCSAIGAAHLVGETAGATRFGRESAFALHNGTTPLPVSSGKSERCRLNRTDNRRLNSTICMIALTQARMYPQAIAFMEKKRFERMSHREALRCLKRHISRAVFRTMLRAERARSSSVVRVDLGPGPVAVAV